MEVTSFQPPLNEFNEVSPEGLSKSVNLSDKVKFKWLKSETYTLINYHIYVKHGKYVKDGVCEMFYFHL